MPALLGSCGSTLATGILARAPRAALGREAALGGPAVEPLERVVEALGRAARARGRCEPGARRPWRDRAGPSRASSGRRARCGRRATAGRARTPRRCRRRWRASAPAERHRVLERHAGALRQVLQQRMGGVAEQRRAAVRPASRSASRSAVAQRFQLFGRSSRRRARAPMPSKYDSTSSRLPSLTLQVSGVAAVEGDDDVVLVAAAQRVVNEVAVRADPDRGAHSSAGPRGSRRRRRRRGRRRGRRRARRRRPSAREPPT